MFAGRHCPC